MLTEQMISCFIEIAEKMVKCGAEVYRVEECMDRICIAYGAERVDAFVTTSNMTLNVQQPGSACVSMSRRIKGIGTDIEKLDKLNSLVRYITAEKPDIDEIKQRLAETEQCKKYNYLQLILFYAVTSGAFTVFFGGRNIGEIIVSITVGAITGLLNILSDKVDISKIARCFVCSAASSFLAFLSVRAGISETVDYIIIGSIMSLIPGVGFTNAIRDLFTGDTVTGVLRTMEAVLQAASMALGYIVVAYMMRGAV